MTRATFEQSSIQLGPRAISTELSTCGYLNGDPDKERTADSGFNCRVDTRHGLWGFCPTTVLTASDCGLAGHCIDRGSCSTGCGIADEGLTTFTCGKGSFCSTAILTFGIDQEYMYLACNKYATVEHYLVTPVLAVTTATTKTEQTSQEPTSTTVSSDESSTTIELAEQTSTQTTSSSSGEKSLELGPVIGGAVGGLIIICATVIGGIYLLRRNRRREDKEDFPKADSAKTFWAKNGDNVPQELQSGWILAEMPAEQKARGPVELAA
ncbi:hypothetical protein FPOAC1_005004 [Fusarium poae]|nr:hypothetical protein FPOAC1_005004 [Fusarium poae]KAG8671747.1 hypothetical protein FPOAC1_005004 [Fusarium poae]